MEVLHSVMRHCGGVFRAVLEDLKKYDLILSTAAVRRELPVRRTGNIPSIGITPRSTALSKPGNIVELCAGCGTASCISPAASADRRCSKTSMTACEGQQGQVRDSKDVDCAGTHVERMKSSDPRETGRGAAAAQLVHSVTGARRVSLEHIRHSRNRSREVRSGGVRIMRADILKSLLSGQPAVTAELGPPMSADPHEA